MSTGETKIGGEFELIRQFFTQKTHHQSQVDLGVGDDAALFRIASHQQCVVSSDLLISGKHFFADVLPYDLGHKALAVNLSDLAAMGAEPLAFTLSIGLPKFDEAWLSDFSCGLYELAQKHRCDLIGGDTTRSDELLINITVLGQTPIGKAIRRDGAQLGDDVWVSGDLGAAAYALSLLQEKKNTSLDILSSIRHRLERPTPRVDLGLALRGIATAMLDLSDGLAGDLSHLLKASKCGAQIDCDALPLAKSLHSLPCAVSWRYALTGGDDYELCFTAPKNKREVVYGIGQKLQLSMTRIGCLDRKDTKIRWRSSQNSELATSIDNWSGFNHFS